MALVPTICKLNVKKIKNKNWLEANYTKNHATQNYVIDIAITIRFF